MTNTSKERNDLFKNECKIINLKYEYEGYTGTEQWAIVSELTEKELFEFLIELKLGDYGYSAIWHCQAV